MSDIVERMRFWSETRNNNPTAWNLDCGDAADQIERLRAELAKDVEDRYRLAERTDIEIARLRDEIDRLRADLQNAYERTKTRTVERDEALHERNTALAERDEARREYCESEAHRRLGWHGDFVSRKVLESHAREIAAKRGWDCFKEVQR